MVQVSGLNRTWRPFGYWGLTLNVIYGPVVLVIGPPQGLDLTLFAQVYPVILATWAAAAAVRQWGKIKGAET